MPQYKTKSEVIKTEHLAEDIFRLTLLAPQIAKTARPGQFVMVRSTDGYDPLLLRPFSIHEATNNGWIQILYKVIGKGTKLIASVTRGQLLDVIGPLGQGFSLVKQGKICLIGGGIGVAPLYFLAKELLRTWEPADILVLLGARDAKEMAAISADFEELGVGLVQATDDGSLGHHGLVIDLIDETMGTNPGGTIYSCGPHPMLRAVAKICKERGWDCQVSLETMMACGVAACLGCAIPRHGLEGNYLHVCKDGPVFNASEVAWI